MIATFDPPPLAGEGDHEVVVGAAARTEPSLAPSTGFGGPPPPFARSRSGLRGMIR